jgi:hypothetical protein
MTGLSCYNNVPMSPGMKAFLSMAAFFCFAVMFGLALVATQRKPSYECEQADDDER